MLKKMKLEKKVPTARTPYALGTLICCSRRLRAAGEAVSLHSESIAFYHDSPGYLESCVRSKAVRERPATKVSDGLGVRTSVQ